MNAKLEIETRNEEPLYNIGVVSRMTGLTMATLRAWERRYSFPDSHRTAGGHRLYSERDVLRLRWVKERINDGMQTAQAINVLRHQENSGSLTLIEQIPYAQEDQISTAGIQTPHIRSFDQQIYGALVLRDLDKANSLLGEALAFSSPEELILDVIAPVLAEIGDAWEDGRISVATEHLATNFLRHRLLMWMVSGPPPKPARPIVLACAPNEWHEGSLLILGALLRRRRWPVSFLGQAVPFQDLAGFVHDIKPSIVTLIAMTEDSAKELIEWPNFLPEAAQTGKPAIAFGGRIFTLEPEWRTRVAGEYLGDNFREGLNNIERLYQNITP